MCLVTPTRIPYVAPEDIYCYKVLNESKGQLVTPFRSYPIELGVLYTTKDVDLVVSNEIAGGFLHAYASPSYMYKRKGFFTDLSSAKLAMYLAVIPKGTKFYANTTCTELCATALKVIKRIASIDEESLFDTIATDVNKKLRHRKTNETFDNYKDSLTTIESIVKYAKDNNLYQDLVGKYEAFEDGSYEKNLYAYRLIVAVLTEDEKNSLVKGDCYYPYVRFYTGNGYWNPDSDDVKIGTIISDGTSYEVVGGDATYGSWAGLGRFDSDGGVSDAWSHFGFRSVSRREIAEFISRHFGRIVFDLMYGNTNCDYQWVDEGK